jgi:hypothetical protein
MSEKEKFSEKVFIKEGPTPTQGPKALYYKVKSDKGLVFNIGKDTYDAYGPLLPGSTYFMEGNIAPPKPGSGYTHGSRWVDSVFLENPSEASVPHGTMPIPTNRAISPMPQKDSTPSNVRTKFEGFRCGMAVEFGAQAALFKGLNPENDDFYQYATKVGIKFLDYSARFDSTHKEVDF